MIKIDIMEVASYNNLDALKKVWKDSWVLKHVAIKYNTGGFPNEDPETWPFKATFAEGRDEIVVRIYSLAVGYYHQETDGQRWLDSFKLPNVILNCFPQHACYLSVLGIFCKL